MSPKNDTLFGLRDILYLGVAMVGILLLCSPEIALALVVTYVVLLVMALIAELLGR